MIPFAFSGYQSPSRPRLTPNSARSTGHSALQFDTESEMLAFLAARGFHRRMEAWSNGTWRAEIKRQSAKFAVVLYFEDGYRRS